MKETLTSAVMAYKEKEIGWSSLINRISLFVYKYPEGHSGWDEDRRSEFFLQFFPKIPGLIKRYKPRYKFETYLSSSIEWYMKTFRENMSGEEYYEIWTVEISEEEAKFKTGLFESTEKTQAAPLSALLSNPVTELKESCPFALEDNGRLKDPALRRRILYAVMLRAADLDDHRIPAIAALVGVDGDWLFERTRSARELVASKIDRRKRLRNRRNQYWYQFDGARKQLEDVCDSRRREHWERKTNQYRQRYDSVNRSIKSLRITTAHKDIGRILDTPPGTVSSGLHLLRKKWKEMEDSTSERFTSGSSSG